MHPHRTRRQTRMDPTLEEKVSQAREARKTLWREVDRIEETALTVGQAFIRKILRSVDFQNDAIREDHARLLAALLEKFKLQLYVLVDREEALLEHLLGELDQHLERFAGPFRRGPKLGEVSEGEVRDYFQARRAQVCADLADLQTRYRAAKRDSGSWEEAVISYKALALQLVKLFLDQVLILRFLKGEALNNEIAAWEKYIQDNVHPIMAMFLQAVGDNEVELPVLFTDYFMTQGSVRTQAEDIGHEAPPEELAGVEGAAAGVAPFSPVLDQRFLEPGQNVPTMAASVVPQPGTRMPGRIALGDNKDIPARPLGSLSTETKPLRNPINRQNSSNPALNDIMDVVRRMSNLTIETKEAIVQQLTRECAQTEDALDVLAGKYGFDTKETSAEAYGDAAALAHYNTLPNVQLPNFYGNALEFPKWWQMFHFLVDQNPKIPQIMKLHILQKSLKGNAEYLTHQVTFSPHSYATLKNNIKDAFDDSDAALRQLAERMKGWPTLKKNDYKQLAEFTGFATNYVMQLRYFEDGAAFNPKTVVNELYGKFNPQMMGDYRREWAQVEHLKGKQTDREQVVWLLDWLKEQLKVARAYYHADPNKAPIQLGMPSGIAMEFKSAQQKGKNKDSNGQKADGGKKAGATTAETLYATADPSPEYEHGFATDAGRGRGRGGSRRGFRGRGRGNVARGRGRGRGSSSAPTNGNGPNNAVTSNSGVQKNSNVGNGQKHNTDKSESGYDMLPCLFCGQQQHPARSCTQHMKPDTVYLKAIEALLCLNCLKSGHYASACPHPVCSVEGCQARHHKLMHGHGTQSQKKS